MGLNELEKGKQKPGGSAAQQHCNNMGLTESAPERLLSMLRTLAQF